MPPLAVRGGEEKGNLNSTVHERGKRKGSISMAVEPGRKGGIFFFVEEAQ